MSATISSKSTTDYLKWNQSALPGLECVLLWLHGWEMPNHQTWTFLLVRFFAAVKLFVVLLLFGSCWTFQPERGGNHHRVCSVLASPSPTPNTEAMRKQKTHKQGFMKFHCNLTLEVLHWQIFTCQKVISIHHVKACNHRPAVASFSPIISLVSNSEVNYFTRKDSAGQTSLALHFYT